MCVIAVKNKGVAIPNHKALKAMWDANSDGAGLMYALDNKVYIEKGFMSFKDFNRAVSQLSNKLDKKGVDAKDIPMVFHFRITTHGGTSASNTHPFPVSPKTEHLKALDLSTDLAVAHNGIISGMTDASDKTLSDTMVYIADILSPLAVLNKNFYANAGGKTLLENTIGYSKLAFLNKKGEITTIGQFSKGTKNDTQGILFSNLNHEYSYRNTKVYSTPYSSYSATAWDDTCAYEPSGTLDLNLKKLPIGTGLIDKSNKVIAYVKQGVDIYYVSDDDEIYVKSTYYGQDRYVFSTFYKGYATLATSGTNKGKYVVGSFDDLDVEIIKAKENEYSYGTY